MVLNGRKACALLLTLALAASLLTGCAGKTPASTPESTPETSSAPAQQDGTSGGADDSGSGLTLEEMDAVKYNYYVQLNNDIVDVLDSLENYYLVAAYEEEFSLPDTGLPYGYRVYGKNTDLLDDCVYLAGEEPDYGEMDTLILQMEQPLRTLMETFSAISRSNDYADNQYQKAKEYHAAIYGATAAFEPLAYDFLDAVEQMCNEQIAEQEEQMKAEGRLIIYNASHAITLGKAVLQEIGRQEITDETLTSLELTEIRALLDELTAVVADLDAALADNDQLIQESLSNSRPFDGLFDGLIQALEWMIRQVESGSLPDMSGSSAPLGSIGHFSKVLSQCIERYNSVFAE